MYLAFELFETNKFQVERIVTTETAKEEFGNKRKMHPVATDCETRIAQPSGLEYDEEA